MKATILLALSAALIGSAIGEEIYSCTDKTGKTKFQNLPCTATESEIQHAFAENSQRREVESSRAAARNGKLIPICKFNYVASRNGAYVDNLGKTLADAAKAECFANDGRQGPAYSRWYDHLKIASARADSINSSINNTINSIAAPKPKSSFLCSPNGAGSMTCQ